MDAWRFPRPGHKHFLEIRWEYSVRGSASIRMKPGKISIIFGDYTRLNTNKYSKYLDFRKVINIY